jgi:hypothetical protein
MNRKKQEAVPQQIQLELPDYTEEYITWKEAQEKQVKKEETVIIIDIY